MDNKASYYLLVLLLLVQVPLIYLGYKPPAILLLFGLASLAQPLLFVFGQQSLYSDWLSRLRYMPALLLVAIGLAVAYLLLAEALDLPGRLSTWIHRFDVFFSPVEELSSDENLKEQAHDEQGKTNNDRLSDEEKDTEEDEDRPGQLVACHRQRSGCD